MKKRMISFFLALVMVLGLIPVSNAKALVSKDTSLTVEIAEEPESVVPIEIAGDSSEPDYGTTPDGWEYVIYFDGADMIATIEGYSGTETELIVPESIEGFPVESIGDSAFYNCDNLTSIVLPDSLSCINDMAFARCENLTSVSLGSSLHTISYYSFYGCNNLVSIVIPDSVTYIGTSAFDSCEKLSSIVIGDHVTHISECAFRRCSITNLIIPSSVTSISNGAFASCEKLSEIIFMGDAPSSWIDPELPLAIFESVTATAYYPANNPTWTADVMQHYGGNITWLPYTPDNVDPPPPSVDTHDTIDQLTDVDYMLFAELAYKDLSSALGDPTANPVKEPKTIGEFYANKWDKKWSTYDLTYGQVFGSIANWYPASTHSTYLGYQDVVFCNASGDVVIAYRGSDNIAEVLTDPNSFGDWVINDLQSEIFSHALPQIDDALETYTMVAASIDPAKIAVTGHSLGGALADVVAAYSGSKGVSFNAISALDVAYGTKPLWMAKNFEGVNRWSFVDHANEYDILAGTFEEQFYSTRIKPYVAHKSLCGKDALADVVDNHGLHSYLTTDSTGALALTAQTGKYIPDEPITHFSSPLLAGKFKLELGTSGNDFFGSCLNEKKLYSISFGGNGYDQIWTGAKNDYLAGGNGQDLLDGSWGNDTYIYYKGDGMDYINDVGGRDNLYLLGFDDNDVIGVVEQDYLYITCNDEKIIGIKTEGREYEWFTSNAFSVMRQKENGSTVPFDITNYFKPSVYKSRILVGCPVSVEVLDPNGNVVHTLTDGEVGSWYTEYGNFYVFEEENGEYGKVLDLVEGYTARIVGADEGTMDVTYQVPVDGELSEPVSVSGVPVTEDLTATIEETEDGDVYLVVDEDKDGETDSERKLYGECPFTDVPEGSFYYEPVMWAVEEGITNGATETTYNPNGTCLRAQVVTFLHRADGNPEPTSTRNPFTDVKSGDFFYQPVLWAVEKGITNGTSATTFGSYANCNRAAVVTFLWRAAGEPEPVSTDNPFTDVNETDFFYKPVLWAVENGITAGIDATHFGPTTDCNRAQVVTFLYRAYN